MKIDEFKDRYIKNISKEIEDAKSQLDDEDILYDLETEENFNYKQWRSFLMNRGYL